MFEGGEMNIHALTRCAVGREKTYLFETRFTE